MKGQSLAKSTLGRPRMLLRLLKTLISNPVSTQTIQNVLKKCNMKAMVKKKKPLLSTRHQKQYLDFALKYKEWTVKDWKRVI
jgi:hypothetical protein